MTRNVTSIQKLKAFIIPGVFENGISRAHDLGERIIARRNAESMLDIGCGDGTQTIEYAEIAGAKELYGIERSDDLRKKAGDKGIKCSGWDIDGRLKYENESFDLIISNRNIRQPLDTRLFLEECRRCLRINGQFIVITENIASWANICALVMGWQPFSMMKTGGLTIGNPIGRYLYERHGTGMNESGQTGTLGSDENIRIYSYSGLRDLMEDTGFRNIRVYTKGWFPFRGILSDIMCYFDRRHGHFLIATGFRKADIWKSASASP